jgi:tetratricopeptide (TPR) repeat protein
MQNMSEDRCDVICTQNKKSPLFLRLAEKEIREMNFIKGIEILESALENNPGNAAAYFLLGRAHAGDGNLRAALQNFKRGSELIKSEKTYQYYLREVENIKSRSEKKPITSETISSDFERLFENTPVKEKNENKKSAINDPLISETLAKIYLSQGEIKEALRIYSLLIKKCPDKRGYFEDKIAEIKSGNK